MWSRLFDALKPFLLELLKGDSDFSKAIRRNRLSAFLFLMNILLFILLIYMTEQSLNKQVQKNVQHEEIVKLKAQLQNLQNKTCVATPILTPIVTKPIKPPPKPQPNTPYDVRDRLEAIRTKEDE